ncbi:MAG: hypothetical protein KF906_12910 [Actinobacteria bacterium]|nr:hypothetical protein [Actinomycetota bacterium]
MTPESELMASIVASQAALLKRSGFRKRRHCFNRLAADGIVHVALFWMAPKEPPCWTEVPGLRERLYGSFRLDFGVYVPAMSRRGSPRSAWINEYNCQLRRTMGQLMFPDASGDLWWSLDGPSAEADASRLLVGHGLPWLDRFPDNEAVLAAFDREGALPLGMGPAGSLDIADLYRSIGQLADEDRILRAYVGRPMWPGHAEYVHAYLLQRGRADLAGMITTRDDAD